MFWPIYRIPKGLQIRFNDGMRNIDACLYVRPSDRTTLERLVAAKGVATSDLLHRYRDAWDHAADRTPHGQPIVLRPEDF